MSRSRGRTSTSPKSACCSRRSAINASAWQTWWKERGGARVRRFLIEEWDPIGVAGIPQAADEYDSYVGVVGRILREHGTTDEIARYLTDIRENHMAFGPSAAGRAQDGSVAARLVEWFREEMRVADAG